MGTTQVRCGIVDQWCWCKFIDVDFFLTPIGDVLDGKYGQELEFQDPGLIYWGRVRAIVAEKVYVPGHMNWISDHSGSLVISDEASTVLATLTWIDIKMEGFKFYVCLAGG